MRVRVRVCASQERCVTHDLDSPIDYRLTGAHDSEVRVAVHQLLQRPSPLPRRRSRRVASLQHGLINWSVARCGGSRLGSVAAQYRQCVAARGRLHRVATCSVTTAPLVVLFCSRCGSHRSESPPRRTRGSTCASQRSCASPRRVRAAESPLRRIASHRIASHRIASHRIAGPR